MPLNDLPLSLPFILFLLLFVLIGIYPAWKRTLEKIRARLKAASRDAPLDLEQDSPRSRRKQVEQFAELQLNDFEILILWQLAQSGTKGLSRKQLRSKLLLEPPVLRKALEALLHRGMVEVTITSFFGLRFYLSKRGRNYAVQQGYISQVMEQNARL